MAQAQTPVRPGWGITPPGVRFRPAMLAEEGAIMALRRACGWSSDTVPQQFRAMQEGRRQVWIAESDGYVVATITVEWMAEDRQLADGRTVAHISNLVVHPIYRRRGIARGLIAAVECEAARRGRSVMSIGVDHGNDYARRLYEALGYTFLKDVTMPWGPIHILIRGLD